MSKQINDIKTDPVIIRLLERMPDKVADSFSEEQLAYLRNAIGAREWGRHKVDLRGTIKFFKWRYYYVVLAGRNRRTLSEKERRIAVLMNAVLITSFVSFSMFVGLIVLYLIKSALGINLIEGWSLGLWGWFKDNVLN
ncbi:3-phosphoshikimate 1-carboxyvinyltransferase [Alteromonas gracilis]|uniref:3-phosphoshikimate 1-carboxyvinyltransferase n=1 Tax=Alteromonas gracilis TaxID=1479524 RepID=UPI002FE3770B